MLDDLLNEIVITYFIIRESEEEFRELVLFKIHFFNKVNLVKKIWPKGSEIINKRDVSLFTLLGHLNTLRNNIAHHPFQKDKHIYSDRGNAENKKVFKIILEDFKFMEKSLIDIRDDIEEYVCCEP